MNCFFCTAKLKNGFTTHSVELGGGVIVVRRVPCQKCTECGEVFYDDATMETLEKIVSAARKTQSEVFITEFSAQAA